MGQPQELYADAVASLARHREVALRSRCETQEIVPATQKTMAQSRVLVARADALLASNAMRTGWLWLGRPTWLKMIDGTTNNAMGKVPPWLKHYVILKIRAGARP